MSYDPTPTAQDNRTFAIYAMWAGFAGSLLMLAGKLFGFFDSVDAIAGGVTSGSLIGLLFFGRQDEYFQRLIAKSAAWACAVIGVWLFASINGPTRDYVTDHMFGLVLVAATFHVTFAVTRLRGY